MWDGVLLMLTLYQVTLGIEAIGRRLRDLAIAALLGYLLRPG